MENWQKVTYLVEDELTGDIRISFDHDFMASMMKVGLDYMDLLIEGETRFEYKFNYIYVCFLDKFDVKLTNKPLIGLFKLANV